MKYRTFGQTGWQVSEIGFGCARLGGIFSGQKGESGVTALQHALDAGINFFDTADMYAQGEAESLLGQAFQKRREKVIIASKGGYCLPAQRKLVARIKPLARPLVKALGLKRENLSARVSGSLAQNFSPDYLVQALENSLKRLRTDYLDLYQLHSPPAEVIERGDFVEVLERMKQQGKIRFWGIAADAVEDAALALRYPQVTSVQMPFGLLDLDALDSVFAQAEARGVGVIARGCFGGGLLKESLTEAELQATTPKWPQILAYREIARQENRPLLEIALQFALRAPAISVTLLGMRTESHLAANLAYYAASPIRAELYHTLRSPLPSIPFSNNSEN